MFLISVTILTTLLFWIGGGADKFRSPIEVVLPSRYTGVVCARIINVQQLNFLQQYYVDEKGLMFIERGLATSHRRWYFYRRSENRGELLRLEASEWFPIRTENDASSEVAYVVFWVDTLESWRRYVAEQGEQAYCLGRYSSR